MEPPAPIGSAARTRAATARASAAGSCFDRTRGYLAGPPRPRPNDGASLAMPRCSLLLLASRGNRTALDSRAGARRPSPPPSPTGDPCETRVSRAVRLPSPCGRGRGVRGPPRPSAARSSRTPRSDRRREHAPRQRERLLRGAVSIGREDTSQGPHAPDRTMARLSRSLAAPCSSSRREGTGPPSMAALGRGAPHPRPLPREEREPEPARLVPDARCAPFRRRFANVSQGLDTPGC